MNISLEILVTLLLVMLTSFETTHPFCLPSIESENHPDTTVLLSVMLTYKIDVGFTSNVDDERMVVSRLMHSGVSRIMKRGVPKRDAT